MKKVLLALISIMALGLSTAAQATTTVYVGSTTYVGAGTTTVVAAPAVYPPFVKTYTDFWGRTVVVVEKNPKQVTLEGGLGACIISAVVGIKGVADICMGLSNVFKESGDTANLLPIGVMEVSGAALIGACGYLALKSLATEA